MGPLVGPVLRIPGSFGLDPAAIGGQRARLIRS
jgi:hypothetical protein